MKIYTTNGGEMLDDICYRHYGDERQIDNVMRENPGIEQLPFLLPAGVEIKLPDMKKPEKKRVTLW